MTQLYKLRAATRAGCDRYELIGSTTREGIEWEIYIPTVGLSIYTRRKGGRYSVSEKEHEMDMIPVPVIKKKKGYLYEDQSNGRVYIFSGPAINSYYKLIKTFEVEYEDKS